MRGRGLLIAGVALVLLSLVTSDIHRYEMYDDYYQTPSGLCFVREAGLSYKRLFPFFHKNSEHLVWSRAQVLIAPDVESRELKLRIGGTCAGAGSVRMLASRRDVVRNRVVTQSQWPQGVYGYSSDDRGPRTIYLPDGSDFDMPVFDGFDALSAIVLPNFDGAILKRVVGILVGPREILFYDWKKRLEMRFVLDWNNLDDPAGDGFVHLKPTLEKSHAAPPELIAP
jgi:hypothetical protein